MSQCGPTETELRGPWVGELTELVARLYADQSIHLEMLVRFTFGGRLYDDYATPGLSVKATVFQLVEELENHGTTVVLLRAVLKAHPRDDVRTRIEGLCPDALAAAPTTSAEVGRAIAGVWAVQGRLDDPVVRGLMASSRDDLVRLSLEIDVLAAYKGLHDGLHQVHLKHYRQVEDVSKRLGTDPTARDTLASYLVELQTIAADVGEAAEKLPDVASGRRLELRWIGLLGTVVADLNTALDTLDDRAAADAVRKLKSVIRNEPSRVNKLLALTAEGLPLQRLVETLAKVAEVAEAAPAAEPLTRDLRASISSLERLHSDLMGTIAEHWQWQDAETDLWQADEAIHQRTPEALEEFRLLWPLVRERVQTLGVVDPAAGWVQNLERYGREFDAALAAVPVGAADGVPSADAVYWFKRYRLEAMHRFYLIDKSLRTKCGEITALGQPLEKLLAEVPDAG